MPSTPSDSVVWPTGYGRLTSGGTNPYVLAANTWHCVELSFNGTGHVQQLFVDGTQLINATNYPTATVNVTYLQVRVRVVPRPGPADVVRRRRRRAHAHRRLQLE